MWTLVVTEGEHSSARIEYITSLRPELARFLLGGLRAVGVGEDESEIEWDSDDALDASSGSTVLRPDVVGKHARAVLIHREWNGERRIRVSRLDPPAA